MTGDYSDTYQHVSEPREEDGVVEVQTLVDNRPLLQVPGIPALVIGLVRQVGSNGMAGSGVGS